MNKPALSRSDAVRLMAKLGALLRLILINGVLRSSLPRAIRMFSTVAPNALWFRDA